MAIVQLKNVEVTRLDNSGYGVGVIEQTVNGTKTYTQRYKLWFKEAHGLTVGTKLNVSGFLGAKVGEPWADKTTGEERRSVELSVNSPRVDNAPTVSNDEPF